MIIFKIKQFIECWIYPAWGWHNLLFSRSDIVKLKGLCKPYGYSDITERMLYACMRLVVDYVDNEKPFELIDWDHNKNIKNDILEIYEYWTEIRLQLNFESEHEDCDFLTCKEKSFERYCFVTDTIEYLDNYYLEKCINVRGYLWT